MGLYEGMHSCCFTFTMQAVSTTKPKVLHEHGFPVPKPIDHTRHCILMSYIDAYPLYLIRRFIRFRS
jgi:hypothetical protein